MPRARPSRTPSFREKTTASCETPLLARAIEIRDATGADLRVLRVLAHVGAPVPAACAFGRRIHGDREPGAFLRERFCRNGGRRPLLRRPHPRLRGDEHETQF